MKIRWSSHFLGLSHLTSKSIWGIHASNFNSKFVSMSEPKLFLLTGVLTPNFNTMDLVKILEKNKKIHIQIIAVTLKVTSYKTMSKKKKWKKSEKPRFYEQNKLSFENPTLHPLGIFSHMAACRSSSKNTRKLGLIPVFNKKIATGSYGVRIGRAWCSRKACEICKSLI
jgi:hypothetical protein